MKKYNKSLTPPVQQASWILSRNAHWLALDGGVIRLHSPLGNQCGLDQARQKQQEQLEEKEPGCVNNNLCALYLQRSIIFL